MSRVEAASVGRLYLERAPTPPRIEAPMIPSPRRYERTQSDDLLVQLRGAAQRGDRKAVRDILIGRGDSSRRGNAEGSKDSGSEPTTPMSAQLMSPKTPGGSSDWGKPTQKRATHISARGWEATKLMAGGGGYTMTADMTGNSGVDVSGSGGGDGNGMASMLGGGSAVSWGGVSRSPLRVQEASDSAAYSAAAAAATWSSKSDHYPASASSDPPANILAFSPPASSRLSAKQHARSVLELDVATPGPTALHVGCDNGSLAVCNELLRLGASTTAQSGVQSDMTPLHLCAHKGHLECAAALLSRGGPAQLAVTTRKSRTALHIAASKGDGAMVRLLLGSISDAGRVQGEKKFAEDQTARTHVREERRAARFATAMATGGDGDGDSVTTEGSAGGGGGGGVGGRGGGGRASVGGGMGDEGVDGDARKPKLTQKQQVEAAGVAGAAAAVGAFVNSLDAQGNSVLHEAGRVGNIEVARLLLEGGAKPEVRVAGGAKRTAAELALENRHIEVAKLINDYAAVRGKFDWVPGELRGLFDTDNAPP